MAGESFISEGNIADRAEKLEAATAGEAAKAPVVPAPEAEAKAEAVAPEAKTVEVAKDPVTGKFVKPEVKVEEKKAPNDPEELRKWNTKVSMELSDVKKQLEALASTLAKASKKEVNWKDLAKDPAKLEAAIAEDRKAAVEEATKANVERTVSAYKDLTMSEKERRKYDPAYPRWAELLPKMVTMATSADRRVNFDEHPIKVLDQMYELATQDNPAAAAAAPVSTAKTYTEAELAAKVEEARKAAMAEAQTGLQNEGKGAGVGGMGKGAVKGPVKVDKEALWKMPMADLKAAIQHASEK